MTFTPDQQLRALSWKQPYAQLMLHGKIETRTWNTKYRGWVLICASQTAYNVQQIKAISGTQHENVILKGGGYDFKKKGQAIAIGKLVDCRLMTEQDSEKCFVEYRPGLWCHIYEDVRTIEPFDWKGSQGWKTVSDEVKSKIRFI